jgi:hypothetical protein
MTITSGSTLATSTVVLDACGANLLQGTPHNTNSAYIGPPGYIAG